MHPFGHLNPSLVSSYSEHAPFSARRELVLWKSYRYLYPCICLTTFSCLLPDDSDRYPIKRIAKHSAHLLSSGIYSLKPSFNWNVKTAARTSITSPSTFKSRLIKGDFTYFPPFEEEYRIFRADYLPSPHFTGVSARAGHQIPMWVRWSVDFFGCSPVPPECGTPAGNASVVNHKKWYFTTTFFVKKNLNFWKITTWSEFFGTRSKPVYNLKATRVSEITRAVVINRRD